MKRTLSLLPLLALCSLLLATAAAASEASPDRTQSNLGFADDRRWLGADDVELPFSTDEQVLDFLRHAEVVEAKRLSSGINKALKVTLEQDGVRAHAIFRTVNRALKERANRPSVYDAHDSYQFEVAAYKVNRMLRLDRIPPVVMREIDGEPGSLQLWVENASTEADVIRSGRNLEGVARRHLQKQVQLMFDQLIFNFDRHQGNSLYDSYDFLWYIDHTRSFKPLPQLPAADRLAVVEEEFLESLRSLDPKAVKQELRPYLDMMQIDALLKRRKQILRRIDDLIAERGVDAVVFDLESRLAGPTELAGNAAPSIPPASE